jgi:antitoxin VapB
MALSIKNKELEKTARELARITKKPITEAVLIGLKRELERQKAIAAGHAQSDRLDQLMDIARHYAALPTTSDLTDDEILGYDEFGAPTR